MNAFGRLSISTSGRLTQDCGKELVRAEHRRVEPDGVALGPAELLAGSIGDNRAGEHVDVHTAHLVDQVQAGGEVAPLVGAAEFQRAVVFVKQVEEVVALQHLVAELGEGDAFLRVQAAGDRVLGEHMVPRRKLRADVTQEVDDGHRGGPIVVGHETYGVRAFGVQNAADLILQAIGPAGHHVLRVKRTFAGLARVADESGGATDQSDRMMARKLQVTHVDELHEVADMQRCSGGIEATDNR